MKFARHRKPEHFILRPALYDDLEQCLSYQLGWYLGIYDDQDDLIRIVEMFGEGPFSNHDLEDGILNWDDFYRLWAVKILTNLEHS